MSEQGKRKADDGENDTATSDTLDPQINAKRFRSYSPPKVISGLPSVESVEIPVFEMEATRSSWPSKALPSLEDLKIPKVAQNKWPEAENLHYVFFHVYMDDQWKNVLNPAFQTIEHCRMAIETNDNLARMVDECMKTEPENWQPLFDDLVFLRRPKANVTDESAEYKKLQYFKAAFEVEFRGPVPDILLRAMDSYQEQKSKYYNFAFTVVQASGMGKSRLMDHSATLRFTLSFNIHEGTAVESKTYPPFDISVRNFLIATNDRKRPLVFLQALFKETVLELANYELEKPQFIAQKWYNWLKQGSKIKDVGTQRAKFYEKVIAEATKLEALPIEFELRIEALNLEATSFTNRLKELCGNKQQGFDAIVYFDEAHTLFSSHGSLLHHSPYVNLMHILSEIKNIPIFFVFLSTNSGLHSLAPKRTAFPSARVQTDYELIPPFFELPYDAYSRDFSTKAANEGVRLTLSKVCELGQMTKFGRAMWHSYFLSLPQGQKGDTIDLAQLKLAGGSLQGPIPENAKLAALDLRVLIQYDLLNSNSRITEAELVRSYMRCIFNIPESREYVLSGYPSEPLLAEAAGRLLTPANAKSVNIVDEAPRILEAALSNGLLAKGERGELVARTLLTVAHDRAAIDKVGRLESDELKFHRPISMMAFLKNLLHEDIWKEVRKAKSVHCDAKSDDLETAFKDTWINFSHFVLLGDHKSFNVDCASDLLKRGAAMQTYDNQKAVDLAIPLYNGVPEKDSISPENTSIAQFQVKNVIKPTAVEITPTQIGEIKDDLPILSVVMQLGAEKSAGGPRFEIISQETVKSTRLTKSDVERRHYHIVLHGCTSETYSCIRDDDQRYLTILRTVWNPLKDYARQNPGTPEFLSEAQELKSMIYRPPGDQNRRW